MAIYKVKSGDSLANIATKYNTTVSAIKTANKINSVSRGQEIKVPTPKPAPTPSTNLPAYYAYGATQPTSYQNWVTPTQQLNTSWPPRPQITPRQQPTLQTYPTNTLQTYPVNNTLQTYPLQNQYSTDARTALLNQYAGRSTNAVYPGYQGLTPSQAQSIPSQQSGYVGLTPSQSQNITSITPVSPTASMPVYNPNVPAAMRPSGAITADNYGDWVAYWNYQASVPKSQQTPAPPQVMTKAQIWEMKKNARVAKKAQQAAEQPVPVNSPFVGNAVQNLALRAG